MLRISRCTPAAVILAIPVLAFAGMYLFEEDFNDGTLDGTAFVLGTWGVENGQLRDLGGQAGQHYVLTGPIAAADYTASATMRMPSGNAGLIVRFIDHYHYYSLGFDSASFGVGRSLAIYKFSPTPVEPDSLLSGYQGNGVYYHLLAGAEFPFDLSQTYMLSVRVVGNTLTVSVDGTPMLTAVDYDNAYTGIGGVGLISQVGTVFDDWRVQSLRRGR